MITNFKNRGHFCNYCRKILSNKSPEHLDMNPAIWTVWDSGDKNLIQEFIMALASTKYNPDINHPVKRYNDQLRPILKQYADEKYINMIKNKKWSKIKSI